MKKLGIMLVLLFFAGSLAALLGPESKHQTQEKLVLTGSSTVAPLALEIGKRFESLNSNVRIDVQTGGSSRGINDARSGLADVGMASRALKEDEKDLFSYTIALDGISLIINQDNPIEKLTKQQIIDIYTGIISNWRQVGGHDARITVVNKAEGRSTLELFLHHFGLKNQEVRPQVVIGDNQQGIKTVAANPGTIGYVSIGAAEYEAEHGTAIKLLPLQGIKASVANVRNGSFPLARPLNLITRTEPSNITKRFIQFAQSQQVSDLAEVQYFVPVSHR